jgi:hypothetical protein
MDECRCSSVQHSNKGYSEISNVCASNVLYLSRWCRFRNTWIFEISRNSKGVVWIDFSSALRHPRTPSRWLPCEFLLLSYFPAYLSSGNQSDFRLIRWGHRWDIVSVIFWLSIACSLFHIDPQPTVSSWESDRW